MTEESKNRTIVQTEQKYAAFRPLWDQSCTGAEKWRTSGIAPQF